MNKYKRVKDSLLYDGGDDHDINNSLDSSFKLEGDNVE